MVAEVTTIPTVVHADMPVSGSAEVFPVGVIIATVAMNMPGMTSTIGGVEYRTPEEEVVAMWITGIDTEVPVACLPVEWTIEIGGCDIGLPLPIVQDITQVEVTTIPIGAKHIGAIR